MILVTVATFVAGAALLIVGAELLVRGASRLALGLGVSPLVVGLTVVAFGTSSPEIAVSVRSALAGSPEILVGNVVGSNIANVLLVLGVGALLRPIVVDRKLVRLEVPLVIAASALVLLLVSDGTLGRGESAFLLAGSLVYTVFVVRQARREPPPAAALPGAGGNGVTGSLVRVTIGLAGLVVGADLMVGAAVDAARALGVREIVIGLTVVAVGTSLPEIATSVLAAARGESDLAVGNVVGSNLLNLLAVLGLAGTVSRRPVPVGRETLTLDLPVMLATAVACLPVFFTGHRIARWEGGLFVAYYAAYVAYVVLDAGRSAALPVYAAVMLKLVIPLTVVTLGVLFVRALRTERRARS